MFLKVLILCHFNQKCSIKVEIDASEFAILAILTQCKENEKSEQHWLSVMFWSKKMKSAELKYNISDQELLAIVKTFVH